MPNNADLIKKYEDFVAEMDLMLQDGVVFSKEELERLAELNVQLDAIIGSISNIQNRLNEVRNKK